MFKAKTLFVLVTAFTLGFSDMASAVEGSSIWQELKDINWEDGRLKIEGQVWNATRSGRRSRSGDYGVVGTIEKEFALGQKLAVGARLIPLFVYDQDDHDGIKGETVIGAGFGVSLRYYFSEVQDGWYGEFQESIIGHDNKFQGNSGSANFMSEIGIGYEFDNDWHVALKWRHLSNAGLADHNSGINAVGIAIGRSF